MAMKSVLKFNNVKDAFIVKYNFEKNTFKMFNIFKLLNSDELENLFILQKDDQIDISTDLNFITYTEPEDYDKNNSSIWSSIVLKRNFVTEFVNVSDYNNSIVPFTDNIICVLENVLKESFFTLHNSKKVYTKKNITVSCEYSYIIIKYNNDIDEKIVECFSKVDEQYKNIYNIYKADKILYTILLTTNVNSDPATIYLPLDKNYCGNNGILVYYQCPKINIKEIDVISNNRIAIKPIYDLKKFTGLCLCQNQNSTYSYAGVLEENSVPDLKKIESYSYDY